MTIGHRLLHLSRCSFHVRSSKCAYPRLAYRGNSTLVDSGHIEQSNRLLRTPTHRSTSAPPPRHSLHESQRNSLPPSPYEWSSTWIAITKKTRKASLKEPKRPTKRYVSVQGEKSTSRNRHLPLSREIPSTSPFRFAPYS